MNQLELAAHVKGMRDTAAAVVRRHAAIYARDVTLVQVEAICRALGDISIDEALEVLTGLQADHGPART